MSVPSSTKKPSSNNSATPSSSTWFHLSKTENTSTWSWNTSEEEILGTTSASTNFSMKNKQVFVIPFRICSWLHHPWTWVHSLQRNHPQRPKTLKPRLLVKWLPQNNRFRSGKKKKIKQFIVNQWYSWLHGSRSYLQDEPFFLSRLFRTRSHHLRNDDGVGINSTMQRPYMGDTRK